MSTSAEDQILHPSNDVAINRVAFWKTVYNDGSCESILSRSNSLKTIHKNNLLYALYQQGAQKALLESNNKKLSMLEIALERYSLKPEDRQFLRRFIARILQVAPTLANNPQYYSRPLLHFIIEYHLDEEIFKLLLRYCDINKHDKNGNTVLHMACLNYEWIPENNMSLLLEQNHIDVSLTNNEGLTPLDLLITLDEDISEDVDYTDDQSVAESEVFFPGKKQEKRYHYLSLLLDKKADPTHLFEVNYESPEKRSTLSTDSKSDTELDEKVDISKIQMSVLHWISENGDYSYLKCLLRFNHFDLNAKDSRGWTALIYAANNNHYNCVYLLLRQPNITIDINIVDKFPEESQELIKLKKEERQELQRSTTHWIRSLDQFYYQRRTDDTNKRTIWIEAERHSIMLKALHSLNRPIGNTQTNYATAAFNFIVSTKEGFTEDYLIEVNLEDKWRSVSGAFENDDDFKEYLDYLNPPIADYPVSRNENRKSARHRELDVDNFRKCYNHSEQPLFAALFINLPFLESVIDKLIERLPEPHNLNQYKVVGLLLYIYTDRYMCQNCQAAAIAFQNNGQFIQQLTGLLTSKDFRIKTSALPFTILVTADQPLSPSVSSNNPPEEDQKIDLHFNEEDHVDVSIDLRSIPRGHLFFRNLSNKSPSLATFTSGSTSAQARLAKTIRERDQALAEANKLRKQNELLKSNKLKK